MVPVSTSQRKRICFEAFYWRIATPEDSRNFAGVLAGDGEWERVTIPHFRDPIGKAETITELVLNPGCVLEERV